MIGRHPGKTSPWPYLLALAFLNLSLPASAAKDIETARTQFDQFLDKCAQQFGYVRNKELSFGDHELAPGEQQYRECAYEGVDQILIPNTTLADDYRHIVAEDKRMTDQIVAKKMTRKARRERLDKLIAAIDKKEELVRAAEMERVSRDMERLERERDALQKQMERARKMQRMTRRMF